MFIDPLPQHVGWPTGWAFLCDILLRLPLSIFVKVVNITHTVEGLEGYLKHRVKQHLLLKHLPMEIRQGLIFARKYIFSVHEVVTNMVYLGLAQFGPHSLKVNLLTIKFLFQSFDIRLYLALYTGKGPSLRLPESENLHPGHHFFCSRISSHHERYPIREEDVFFRIYGRR